VDFDRDEWMDGVPPARWCPICARLVPVWDLAAHRHERRRRGLLDRIVIAYVWVFGLAALFLWGLIFMLIIIYGSGG
jgi:hypothetical protein